MDRRQFAVGSLALGLGCAGGARAADPTAPPNLVADILKQTKAPALAGLAISKDRQLFLDAAGVRRNGAPDRVTTADKWHRGSNTKAMTAAVYGRLVEKGKAKWGATLPQLFPDLALSDAWKATTIEQIMGHRAGLIDEGLMGAEWAEMLATPKPVRQERTELLAKALALAPKGQVGAYHYANVDYLLVGAAIERILDKPWEDAIREELWAPLGITSGGFGAPGGANPWGHAPAFFGSTSGPRPLDPASPDADNPPALGPAGTAHMTLADYGKWMRLFLTDGGGVLKPETIRKLITPVGPPDSNYALGWGVIDDPKGKVITHSGSNTYWFLTAIIVPSRNIAVVVASNDASADGGQKATQMLGKQLITLFAAPAT
jgi:CubicO group peptidase (beta-lactamase class C family)